MRFYSYHALLFLLAASGMQGAEKPRVTHIGTVASHILGVTVRAGRVEYGRQSPYTPRPGDSEEKAGDYQRWGWLRRDGRIIDGRVGRKGDLLMGFDRVIGDSLDTEKAGQPENYRLFSPDDPAYKEGVQPRQVFRKTKPTDLARVAPWDFQAPMEHTLYLVLPRPLQPGKRYLLNFGGRFLPSEAFAYRPSSRRSEAVHVSHLGFRPDDPVKAAFLSCWMGNGGGVRYEAGMPFLILDVRSGQPVLKGKTALSKAASDQTEDVFNRNYNLADVWRMDFSVLKRPGVYRVYVPGVGCSYPFEIGKDVWRKAFRVAARGFYHQRSGIALGPPYTWFKRPRSFHPADGVKVCASTCGLLDSGNGLNALGTDKDNFGNLVKGKTDRIVPDAWGGYFDAGDWDRRIQHLEATRLLLELAEMFPGYMNPFPLNIPESGNALPDLIDESLWNLDCYRRMQTQEGGIRGGIESAEHPQFGEGSWQESLTVMAYAPDPWSSYVYAGVAARAARLLAGRHAEKTAIYRRSALRAMEWAEGEYARRQNLPHPVADARNLAAAELFRLTGGARWHRLFLATTVFSDPKKDIFEWQRHHQGDAAFVYARLRNADPAIRNNCRQALLRAADACAAWGRQTAFGWTKADSNYAPVGIGALSVPQAVHLVRAHYLTRNPAYLKSTLLAAQSSAGANPLNICYTTGLGRNSPKHPLWIDNRIGHQPPPPGLTVYGPIDVERHKDEWAFKLIAPYTYPAPDRWPTTEAYFDVFWFPLICEFTVMQTLGPNTYVWGYLAARP
ncbi:MAG: glycoside hydrolase family 9 protein [Armatimonadetes bacterium]|nr:glycoside hydrolase family 9 protein [Armatimonadota bacterium]